MKSKTFKGGIHPPPMKDATRDAPIERVPPPKTVSIPINQQFGAPNECLVAVGDRVLKGQKIADYKGAIGAPVHASITGMVKKIEYRAQIGANEGFCVLIEADGTEESAMMARLDPFTLRPAEILERIKEAGIVGMGGAGFPAHAKLNPPPGKKANILIGNGAECEPYLSIDQRTMREYPLDVVRGAAIAMRCLDVSEGAIGIEEHNAFLAPILGEAIAKIETELEAKCGSAPTIRVELLKAKYPQGGEKMLITAITGREVPSGGLPVDAGAVVLNVGSLKAISDAFIHGLPQIERGLTVAGGACKKPRNIVVPVGTLVSDLVPEWVDFDERAVKFVSGGPMMGIAQGKLEVPVQKNTSGLLFLTAEETYIAPEGQCIRCGRCMRVCGCRLEPMLLNQELMAGDLKAAEEIGLLDCIECATCAWVCPANVRLVQRFRLGKQLLREKKQREAQHGRK